MKRKIAFVLFLMATWNASWANIQPDSLFQEASNSYNSKNYQQAIAQYLLLLTDGYSSNDDVFYNLGNAYYRNGNVALAIWSYEKCLLLNGANSDAQVNLDFLNNSALGDQESVPENFFNYFWKSIYSLMSWKWWTISVIISLAIAIGLFLMFLLSAQAQRRRIFFVLAVLLAFVFILSLAQSVSGHFRMKNNKYAIVLSEAATIKSSPDTNGTSIAVLMPGVKVKIVEDKNPWIEIIAPDGSTGWMLESELLPLSATIPSL
jgi:tetratricopeptide (TPR) repeat protein